MKKRTDISAEALASQRKEYYTAMTAMAWTVTGFALLGISWLIYLMLTYPYAWVILVILILVILLGQLKSEIDS
jgi:hypothetical protein